MRKDLHSNISIIDVLGPITLAADNTPAAIDLAGFDSAELVLGIGIGGITFDASNKIEFKWTTSADGVTYTAVSADDIVGEASVDSNGLFKSLVAAHAAANFYRFGYRGTHRYHKLLVDFTGTHGTGTPVSACFVVGHPIGGRPLANDA